RVPRTFRWPPVGLGEDARAVRDVDRHVTPAPLRLRRDLHLAACQLPTQVRSFPERQAPLPAAADVHGQAAPAVRHAHLLLHQIYDVGYMEDVAHLLAAAAIADVREVAPEVVAQ